MEVSIKIQLLLLNISLYIDQLCLSNLAKDAASSADSNGISVITSILLPECH